MVLRILSVVIMLPVAALLLFSGIEKLPNSEGVGVILGAVPFLVIGIAGGMGMLSEKSERRETEKV